MLHVILQANVCEIYEYKRERGQFRMSPKQQFSDVLYTF